MSCKKKKSVWANHLTAHVSVDGYWQATVSSMAEDKGMTIPQVVKLISSESASFNKYFESLIDDGLFKGGDSFYDDCKKKEGFLK